MRYNFLEREERIALPNGQEAWLKHVFLREEELPPAARRLWELAKATRAIWTFAFAEGDGGRTLKGTLAFTFAKGKASLVLFSSREDRWERAYLSVRGKNVAHSMREAQKLLCPLISEGLLPVPVAMVRRNATFNYALEEVPFKCEEV